jgi:hypothetical protein
MHEKVHEKSEVTTDDWFEESDDSINEKCYFISSASNIRRREMHGQGRYYRKEEKTQRKPKKKAMKKGKQKVEMASLKEMQEEVKKKTAEDNRGRGKTPSEPLPALKSGNLPTCGKRLSEKAMSGASVQWKWSVCFMSRTLLL